MMAFTPLLSRHARILCAKRCDVHIRHQYGDRYYTATECKIGQNTTQRRVAVKDAQRWLKQADCWNAIACCYPVELSKDGPTTASAEAR